jgi:hypothetical protein
MDGEALCGVTPADEQVCDTRGITVDYGFAKI